MQSDPPVLVIRFLPPADSYRLPVRVTLPGGRSGDAVLRLPFPIERVGLLACAVERLHDPGLRGLAAAADLVAALSASAPELADLGLWEGGTADGWLRPDVAHRLGEHLGGALLDAPAVRNGLDALVAASQAAGGAELRLAFEERAFALAALPWEAARHHGLPLLAAGGAPIGCSRQLLFAAPTPPARPLGRPLRILTVTPEAWMSAEQRRLGLKLRAHVGEALDPAFAVVEALEPATLPALAERLGRGPGVDLLDFYGHGAVTTAGGALVLDRPGGGHQLAGAGELASLAGLPPLALLSACLGAWAASEQPASSVAAGLCRAGVGYVVAFQHSVQAALAAEVVAPAFYRGLAAGATPALAVAAARRAAVQAEAADGAWYLPLLYARHHADEQPPALVAPRVNPFRERRALRDPRAFVGRRAELIEIWSLLQGGENVSIVGPPGSGKSALLRHLAAEIPRRLGQRVQTISLPIERSARRGRLERELARKLGGPRARADECRTLMAGRHLVLLLDDLGQLHAQNQDGLDVRLWLRTLSGGDPDYNTNVQLLATSVRPLYETFAGDQSPEYSPLWTAMSAPVRLPAFSEADARLFIASHLADSGEPLDPYLPLLERAHQPEALRLACLASWEERRRA